MSSPAEHVRLENEAAAAPEPAPAAEPVERRRRPIMGIVQILAVVAAVALAIAYSREAPTAAAPVLAAPPAPAAETPLVRVLVPERGPSQVSVRATGAVEVRSNVALAPQVGGQVVEVADSLRAGGSFNAGDVLFIIDPRDYELAVAQAEADLAAALSRLKLRQAEGDAARENYALLHGDAPVPDLVAKVPQIEQSLADVASAEARLARAELDLSRTAFALPFDGRITETSIFVGQTLNTGQSFGSAFPTEAIEVAVPISQDDLASLTPVAGRNAEVRVAGERFSAVIDRRSATLDERSRFARLFLTLDDGVELPPGTFVDVTLSGDDLTSTFVLPEASEQAGSSVWRVVDGQLSAYAPQVYARTSEGLIVEAFDVGEGIVLGSVPGAEEGLAVRTESFVAPGGFGG
ncbi:MAG: efflux RND transporter periplasmic adaptor subunit [Pseudomonadota bacterium]